MCRARFSSACARAWRRFRSSPPPLQKEKICNVIAMENLIQAHRKALSDQIFNKLVSERSYLRDPPVRRPLGSNTSPSRVTDLVITSLWNATCKKGHKKFEQRINWFQPQDQCVSRWPPKAAVTSYLEGDMLVTPALGGHLKNTAEDQNWSVSIWWVTICLIIKSEIRSHGPYVLSIKDIKNSNNMQVEKSPA